MSDLLGYKGKRVVVSGCFSGMGEATAKLLLDLGAEVHGLDFKPCGLPLASFNTIDLRDPATIEAGVATIGGKIDALRKIAAQIVDAVERRTSCIVSGHTIRLTPAAIHAIAKLLPQPHVILKPGRQIAQHRIDLRRQGHQISRIGGQNLIEAPIEIVERHIHVQRGANIEP